MTGKTNFIILTDLLNQSFKNTDPSYVSITGGGVLEFDQCAIWTVWISKFEMEGLFRIFNQKGTTVFLLTRYLKTETRFGVLRLGT